MTRVVLTHPQPRVLQLAESLEKNGHSVLPVSFSEIVSSVLREGAGWAETCPVCGEIRPNSPASYEDTEGELGTSEEACYRCSLQQGLFDWVVWASPTSISMAPPPLPWPSHTSIAVMGPGSKEALCKLAGSWLNTKIVMPPGPIFDAQNLIQTPEFSVKPWHRVLVLKGKEGGAWLGALRERSVFLRVVCLYSRRPVVPPFFVTRMLCQWLDSWQENADAVPVCVFSLRECAASFTRFLEELLGEPRAKRTIDALPALAIHPKIALALRQQGWGNVREVRPGVSFLLDELNRESFSGCYLRPSVALR